MIRRLLSNLFPGAEHEPRHARTEPGPTADFLDPYTEAGHAAEREQIAQYARGVIEGRAREQAAARLRGQAYRAEWSNEPTIAAKAEVAVEGKVTPGSRPLTGGAS